MFCGLCQKYNKKPFARGIWNTVPCTRLRQQSITAHEVCASEKLTTIPNTLTPKIPAKGIEQAFVSLYFLAKQRIPLTTNFEPLLDLLELLGVNVKSRIQIAINALYTSDKSVQEMISVISEVIEVRILDEMEKSNHFSLMIDESTDCTVTEHLVLHGRYIDLETRELKSHYLKVLDVLEPEVQALHTSSSDSNPSISLSAQTITNRVEYIEAAGFDVTRMRGIGTDGASTMIGCHNGVVKRLKSIAPSLIGVHCAALSTERSVNRLKKCYVSVVLSLQREGEERSDAKAIGLNNLITEYRFICTMLM